MVITSWESRCVCLDERMNFSSANTKIKEIFASANLVFKEDTMDAILTFLSKIHIYEEEENKIIPEIIIGSGLTNELFGKLFQCEAFPIILITEAEINIEKIVKPIIPFCDNGWRLFINIDNGSITTGIMRSFAGPSAPSLLDNLLTPIPGSGINYVLIDVVSKFEIRLFSSNNDVLEIDYRLIYSSGIDRNTYLQNMVEDLVSSLSLENDEMEAQKNAFLKILTLSPKRVHGTICLIIKKECPLPLPGLLEDGIILPAPIDLSQALNELLRTPDVSSLSEKYYALTGLLLLMMNTDGITILDNCGKIRGYNFFIKPSVTETEIIGGARKRAAYSLIESKNSNLIGVYFQSQDGDIIYERVNTDE